MLYRKVVQRDHRTLGCNSLRRPIFCPARRRAPHFSSLRRCISNRFPHVAHRRGSCTLRGSDLCSKTSTGTAFQRTRQFQADTPCIGPSTVAPDHAPMAQFWGVNLDNAPLCVYDSAPWPQFSPLAPEFALWARAMRNAASSDRRIAANRALVSIVERESPRVSPPATQNRFRFDSHLTRKSGCHTPRHPDFHRRRLVRGREQKSRWTRYLISKNRRTRGISTTAATSWSRTFRCVNTSNAQATATKSAKIRYRNVITSI